MFCKNCGTEIDDQATVCPNCGAEQQAPQAEPQAQPAPQAEPQPAQQAYYQQPPQAQPAPQRPVGFLPVTEAEKSAYFKSVSTVPMLLVTIIATVALVIGLISNVLSLNILGIIGMVLDVLIVVGMWMAWSNAKKKNLNPTSIKLIRIPYLIQFIFTCISFALTFLALVIVLAVGDAILDSLGSLIGIEGLDAGAIGFLVFMLFQTLIPFVFECIIFSSLNKTLKVAQNINNGNSALGYKAGKALGIVLIIAAAVSLILAIVNVIFALNIFGLISAIFSAVYMIIGAIVLLGFAKNMNAINGRI